MARWRRILAQAVDSGTLMTICFLTASANLLRAYVPTYAYEPEAYLTHAHLATQQLPDAERASWRPSVPVNTTLNHNINLALM